MKRPANRAEFAAPDEAELEKELATPAELPIDNDHGRGADHPDLQSEQSLEHARQQSMAAREKAARTHMPAGQATTMHRRMSNQPRGGR